MFENSQTFRLGESEQDLLKVSHNLRQLRLRLNTAEGKSEMATIHHDPTRDHEGEIEGLTLWNMTESFRTIVLDYVDGRNDTNFVGYVKFVCDMFRDRPGGDPFQEAMRWICMYAGDKRRGNPDDHRPWDSIHCGNPAPDEGGSSVFFFRWAEAAPNGAYVNWSYDLRTKKAKVVWRASEKYGRPQIAFLLCWTNVLADGHWFVGEQPTV
jgi:hypothetical protein